ncbi:ABC transporter permease [Cohnella nanjingensis]|uniref:ABC-2 family transporter protein n=1 Tax=Cohnella nanjingensis TaxID=1387779 RepID=A0A7X0RT36_9BACL|nr:ABC-2 family transporter protein [Cohnella nanjingensis]MBB6673187.1 ABC-2 family transporter protein [Cohnella nanjingensis]
MSTEANRVGGIWRFLVACWKANLSSALEYRLSFLLLAGMMLVNNLMWLFFWSLFFARFPVVQGWELRDVMMLWAISAGGFGWASVLFGNYYRIATIVSSGQLDVYLSQPKPVLLHVLASRMSVMAAGDFLFGLLVYAWAGDHTIRGFLLFAAGLLLAGLLFMGIMIIVGCLAFWYGNSEGIAQQVFNSFVALTTYPSDIFRGVARTILFSVVPAGFISYLPIGLLRYFDPAFVFVAVLVTLGLLAIGIVLFYVGLRRYASGNAITVRQ